MPVGIYIVGKIIYIQALKNDNINVKIIGNKDNNIKFDILII